MKISKKVKIAIAKAEKEARKKVSKPKKKRRVAKNTDQQPKNPSSRWIKDEWGDQGEVFFDGKLYWLTILKQSREPGIWDVMRVGLSEEKWEEYKKKPVRTGLLEQNSETSGTGKQLSSTQKITSSTKRLKVKPKKKSSMNAGKTVTQPKQVRWQ